MSIEENKNILRDRIDGEYDKNEAKFIFYICDEIEHDTFSSLHDLLKIKHSHCHTQKKTWKCWDSQQNNQIKSNDKINHLNLS